MNEMTQADYILGHSQIEMRRLMWQWTQIGWGPSHGPNGGVADTLNEAKAAFRAAGRARSQDHPCQPAGRGAYRPSPSGHARHFSKSNNVGSSPFRKSNGGNSSSPSNNRARISHRFAVIGSIDFR